MRETLCVAVAAAVLLAVQVSTAAQWGVEAANSRIGFVATYDGIPFEARFRSFEIDIRFDPENLEESSFDIRIDTTSLDSNSRDRDEGMRGGEWFNVEEYPSARFEAGDLKYISGDRYRAAGTLTLKGNSKRVEVPFAWRRISDSEAVLVAETHLDRREFDIGTGDWVQDDIIGFDVIVETRLELSRSQHVPQ